MNGTSIIVIIISLLLLLFSASCRFATEDMLDGRRKQFPFDCHPETALGEILGNNPTNPVPPSAEDVPAPLVTIPGTNRGDRALLGA